MMDDEMKDNMIHKLDRSRHRMLLAQEEYEQMLEGFSEDFGVDARNEYERKSNED